MITYFINLFTAKKYKALSSIIESLYCRLEFINQIINEGHFLKIPTTIKNELYKIAFKIREDVTRTIIKGNLELLRKITIQHSGETTVIKAYRLLIRKTLKIASRLKVAKSINNIIYYPITKEYGTT